MDFIKKHLYRLTAGIGALACLVLVIATQPDAVSQPPEKPSLKTQIKAEPQPVATPKKIGTAQLRGWLETSSIPAVKERAKAKLDTGAKTSSINAEIIKTFKRDKKQFVLFRVDLDKKHKVTLEREIVRWTKIKNKLDPDKPIKRPVVNMSFCIGSQLLKGETNLTDRDHFNYPILIGRNMLSSHVIVDASRTFTAKPTCDLKK